MHFIRLRAFDVYWTVWTILLGLLVPVLWLIRKPALVRKVTRIWSCGIIWGLKFFVGLTHREIGLQNKPRQPALYVCNHQSAWETLVFNVLIPNVAIVLKQSLYRFPIVGWFLRHSPMIAIDRDAGARAAKDLMLQAQAAAEEGRSILIFPEGTRQPVDVDEPFHRGVALLYKRARLPAVPVALNSGVFWPGKSLDKQPGKITISYLPAIEPGLATDEFMTRVESAIKAEKKRLLAQAGNHP